MLNIQDRLKRKKVLVAGDIMLDEYLTGSVSRISPEAPVPVFLEKERTYTLGGAANVAANLAANGMETTVLSVIGNDEDGRKIENLFVRNGIRTDLLVRCQRPTSRKCRLLAENNQQVIRIDSEDASEIGEMLGDRLLQMADDVLDGYDAVVLSDYLKGVLSFGFTKKLAALCRKHHVITLADAKDARPEKYKGVYLIKPNKRELSRLTSMPVSSIDEVYRASVKLRKACDSEYVLATCGAEGMLLVSRDGMKIRLHASAREVFDVTGAGDTVIAYLAMCIANGFGMKEAMEAANAAAGIQVSKTGTSLVLSGEVDACINREKESGKNTKTGQTGKKKENGTGKMLGPEELRKLRQENPGKKIVFTNGCFDILHVGHVRCLKEAAKQGDILIAGLNSDASVRRLKGAGRPVNCESDRAEMLSSYEFVDYVSVFEQDTPYELISACEPDIIVKGGDYRPDEVAGKDIVEKRGGKVVIVPLEEGKSTTEMIMKMTGSR